MKYSFLGLLKSSEALNEGDIVSGRLLLHVGSKLDVTELGDSCLCFCLKRMSFLNGLCKGILSDSHFILMEERQSDHIKKKIIIIKK